MSERKLKIAALLKELYGMAEVPVPSSRIPFYFYENSFRNCSIYEPNWQYRNKKFTRLP